MIYFLIALNFIIQLWWHFILKILAAHLQPAVHFFPLLPPVCRWLSCLTRRSVAVDDSVCDTHHSGNTAELLTQPNASIRHMSDIFPFGLFTRRPPLPECRPFYRTAFSQLLQSAAAFIWRRSEFICRLPPRLKHQIVFLFVFLLLLFHQQPLNSGSTYQLWDRHRGTTALRDLSSSHFVRSAGIFGLIHLN